MIDWLLWKHRIHARIGQPLDNRLWRFWRGDTARYRIHHKSRLEAISYYEPELRLDELRQGEPAIHDYVVHRYSEYAYRFTIPLLIEPKRAWLIPSPLEVLEESFPMVRDPWDGMKPRPSTWRYFARRNVAVTLERAVVVSYAWQNYYHFFVDTLPQLALLDRLGIDREIPIVVPEHFATISYIQDFRRLSSFLDGRTFVIQRAGEYIRVTEATHVAKDVFFSPALSRILNTLGASSALVDGAERIFLRRNPAGPRALSNDEEITRLAEQFGYRVVDTAGLTLQQQIEMFRRAGVVVGIHGAGLTNILFRHGQPLALLELAPASLGSTHYRSICKQFGYHYARVEGSHLDANGRFAMNTEVFKQALIVLDTKSTIPSENAVRS